MSEQAIVTPFGISVFGSAIVRVAPDVAVISFSVSQVRQQPQEAFQAVREAAQQVQTYLASAQIEDAGSSHINLVEEWRISNGENKFFGYRTRVDFRVLLSDLARLDTILVGVLESGANRITAVSFQTTQLKAIRAEARQQAIRAAREKAENYCAAAGVTLGAVIHIEDIDPNQLRGHEGHDRREIPLEEGDAQAFDPSSITVGGAVRVAYKIQGA
jgi:hypothetical protein